MKPARLPVVFLLIPALLLVTAGCMMQPSPHAAPVVWIVYGSEKGDLSYTDVAYRGLATAQRDMGVSTREFVPRDYLALPDLLNTTRGAERPGLVITVGFQYTNFTRQLADLHPDVRFLAIDQSKTGSGNLRAYEITSYGESYLAGVLAASATRTGHVGIIMGMQTGLIDTFSRGYTDGVRAANISVVVDREYVHQYSTEGFMDPDAAERIAEGMYRNGTDVIFTVAGYSNTGMFAAANAANGRYVIGTDTDKSPLGPRFVLASAVKRVDTVVYSGIADYVNGTFTGGDQVAGLSGGATGLVCNPAFAGYCEPLNAWEDRAAAEEEQYLAARPTMTVSH